MIVHTIYILQNLSNGIWNYSVKYGYYNGLNDDEINNISLDIFYLILINTIYIDQHC